MSKTPYRKVADVLIGYCAENENYYTDFIVELVLDEKVIKTVAFFDSTELDFEFEDDWWEGEEKVILVAFDRLEDIELKHRVTIWAGDKD